MKKALVKRPPLFLFILLGAIGASIGIGIFLIGASSTPESQTFLKSPEAITWIFINVVLFALYPILILLLWRPIHRLRKYRRKKQYEILASSIVLIGLYTLPLWIAGTLEILKPPPLEYADLKIVILEGVGFLVSALPAAIGMWTVQAAVRDRFRLITASDADIKQYILFRNYLHQFLTTLGLLLSLFILASAALRNAIIATGTVTPDSYPSVILHLLGAYYTFLIAILYFPAYIDLASIGQRLLNISFSLPTPGSSSWTEQYSKRKNLEELLELKITAEQRFLTSITLLAPFVSSIFALLLEK